MNEKLLVLCRVAGIAEEAARKLTNKNLILVEQWFVSKTSWHFGNIVKALEYFDWYLSRRKFNELIRK